MKHRHIVALFCYGMTCLASCQSENEWLPSQATELSMSVIARIGETPVLQGRYAGTDLNSAEFATGDSIGIFVDEGEVIRWDYESLSWVSEEQVYWPDKENEHTFRAFYPYASATSYNEVPMPSLLNQTGTMESVAQCDFLTASTTQSYGEDGVVAFQGEGKSFSHVSSLIHLQINASEDLASATLTSISLTGANIVAPSVYSFTDGVKLSPDSQSDELQVALNYDMTSGNAVWYFVVNEKLDATSVVTLALEYTVDGKSYQATKTGFADNVFQGGMQHSYSLTVKNRTLFISGSAISPWEQGNEMEDIIIDAEETEA